MTEREHQPGPTEPASGRISDAYARWVHTARWWIVWCWIAGTGLALALIPAFGAGGDQIASVIPLDSPAIRAELRTVAEFGYPLSSRTAVVQRDPEGLSPFVQAESVLDAVAVNQHPQRYPLLGALPVTNTKALLPFAAEQNTTVLTYLFMQPTSGFATQQRAATRYIDANLNDSDDKVIGVAGSIPARAEQARLVGEWLPRLELFTVLAIVLVVAVNFRSVVAPLLALFASAIAFVVTARVAGLAGALLGFAVPAELEPLLVALLLGIVTDYTIFYVSAYQVRLSAADDPRTGARRAVRSFTPIILVAGLTVAAGTAALLAAESAFFRALGPAMAFAVVIGLFVSVTLIPALLAILGQRVFWPHRPRHRTARDPDRLRAGLGGVADRVADRAFGTEVVRLLTRRRVAAAVLATCIGLLLLASLPIRNMDFGLAFTSSLPPGNSVAKASKAAAEGIAPGITSPTTLLLEGPKITEQRPALRQLQGLIANEPGVAGVFGPGNTPVTRELGLVMSRSGNAARMLVVLDHDPLDATAIKDVNALGDRLPGLIESSGLKDVRASIAGDTALAAGLVGETTHDLVRIAIAAGVVNLVLLTVFLRALVAPLYLLASSILALTASLGLTVWVFQGLLGHDGLTFYVPFAAAVLLVALGSDYNIFAVGHIWDEAKRRSLQDAIIVAVPESARAITAAGITLAVSFGLLAIIPLAPFRELAFAMAVGISLDAVVVRSIVIPCLLTLVGERSGWPGPHLREKIKLPPAPVVEAGAGAQA